jgi:hypothetical protein
MVELTTRMVGERLGCRPSVWDIALVGFERRFVPWRKVEKLSRAVRYRTPLFDAADDCGARNAARGPQGSNTMLASHWSRYLRLCAFSLVSLTAVTAMGAASWHWLSSGSPQSGDPEFAPRGFATPPRMLTIGQPLVVEVEHLPATALQVQVLVGESGEVLGAMLNRVPAEFAMFEDVAIAFVMQAQFTPAKVDGRPITTWTEVAVTFAHNLALPTT